jgi:carbon monoxide dehydrogenase subunit G
MDMTGEYRIPAPRDKVWAALNDPATLKASIPGCESLEQTADNAFAATVVAKVGPVKAKFKGNVTLSEINPPESYTISGEGKGGAAGFAKGGADVKLAEDGDDTILTYAAKADVGGKLAQLGSRLIQGTSKKMADEFFANFKEQVVPSEAPAAAPAETAATTPPPAATAPETPPGTGTAVTPPPAPAASSESANGLQELMQSKLVWVAAAVVVLIIIASMMR